MESMEAATQHSKRQLEVRCSTAGSGGVTTSSPVVVRDQLIAPSFYSNTSMIKFVIEASNNHEQQSILRKPTNQAPPTAAANTAIKTANTIARTVVRPDANTTVKLLTEQKSTTSVQGGESKQPIVVAASGKSLVKLPSIKSLKDLEDKSQCIKRTLPRVLQKTPRDHHFIIKANNGHTAPGANFEMFASSLVARSADSLNARKLPTLKDLQASTSTGKRLEMKPITVVRQNSETSPAEVTQISPSVTLTKAAVAPVKQAKPLPSPLVTLSERKSNSPATTLFNCSKQGKIHFANGTESMDIVVNTIGGSKMISLGNDTEKPAQETVQQQSLLKQPSPPISTDQNSTNQVSPKPRQQSLLKVNSLARMLQRSPRIVRSRSLNGPGNGKIKRRRKAVEERHLSTASDGDLEVAMDTLTSDVFEPEELKKSLPVEVQAASLLCDEKIETLPPSSSSSSTEITPPKKDPPQTLDTVNIKSLQYKYVLDMLAAFNMLSWKDRTGTSKGSKIKYGLNEFNILQIAEKCPPRIDRIHTAYEKPIYERESSATTSDYTDPLYLCRRCSCHGAGIDFLAPEFCSYECYRRDLRKRTTKMTTSRREKLARAKRPRKPVMCNYSNFVRSEIDMSSDRTKLKRNFSWATYLQTTNSEPAPIDLFLNPFPSGANLFEVGMKLEAIDPEHNSLFCVCTVVKKMGYRLKLKFDGYSSVHEFWVNADSMDIFPPGWCSKTNRVLQPPKGMNLLTFNWPNYLTNTKSQQAPRHLFTHLNSTSTRNPFKVGMRLEAIDLKNTDKLCVASIADVLDNRVLIHFDGWDESYDYWIDIDSPYIHPIGWHQVNAMELVPPPDWEEHFLWSEYLEFTQSEPVHPSMFSPRYPIEFGTGMKLEVVDLKNPSLIRPATVLCRNECKILVHLDGWPNTLTFWVNDDSLDIHPIGWCEETGHELEPPPGFNRLKVCMPCPVKGCRGVGNAKRIDIDFHASEDNCPYLPKNWELELEKPSRLDEIAMNILFTDTLPSLTRTSLNDGIAIDEKGVYLKSEPLSDAEQKSYPVDCKPPTLPSTKTKSNEPSATSITEGVKLAREYLCDYGPRLKQNYLIWQENSTFNQDAIKKNPLEWTAKETADYISIKCHPLGHVFLREDIDGIALLSMQQSDLTDILKIKLGPAIKIFTHILHLRNVVVSRFSHHTKPPTDT